MAGREPLPAARRCKDASRGQVGEKWLGWMEGGNSIRRLGRAEEGYGGLRFWLTS